MKTDDPGKYNEACTIARETAQAEGVALIVVNGKNGNGFSVQATPRILLALPDILESMAKAIREDLKQENKWSN